MSSSVPVFMSVCCPEASVRWYVRQSILCGSRSLSAGQPKHQAAFYPRACHYNLFPLSDSFNYLFYSGESSGACKLSLLLLRPTTYITSSNVHETLARGHTASTYLTDATISFASGSGCRCVCKLGRKAIESHHRKKHYIGNSSPLQLPYATFPILPLYPYIPQGPNI